MHKSSVLKTILLSTVAFLIFSTSGKAAHAQVATQSLSWNVGNVTLFNGETNIQVNTAKVYANSSGYVVPTMGMGIMNLAGEGPTQASYNCYIVESGGTTLYPAPFSGTMYSNGTINNQSPVLELNPKLTVGTYSSYCTATFSGGTYGNGTVTTPTLYIDVVAS